MACLIKSLSNEESILLGRCHSVMEHMHKALSLILKKLKKNKFMFFDIKGVLYSLLLHFPNIHLFFPH